jgi:hypothetical protein
MQAIRLISEDSFSVFFFMTVVLGGGAAFLAGRSLAHRWRPLWHAFAYMLLLGLGLRFFHYALFGGTLLSLYYYLIDTSVLMAAAYLGYRIRRTEQMTTQYSWIYERTGPLSWREKNADADHGLTQRRS